MTGGTARSAVSRCGSEELTAGREEGGLARGALWAESRELPVVDMPRTGSPEGLQLGPKAPVFSGSCPWSWTSRGLGWWAGKPGPSPRRQYSHMQRFCLQNPLSCSEMFVPLQATVGGQGGGGKEAGWCRCWRCPPPPPLLWEMKRSHFGSRHRPSPTSPGLGPRDEP